MRTRQSDKNSPKRFLGHFDLPTGQSAVGQLRLKRSRTLLRLHSDEDLARIQTDSCIRGVAYTGENLTLIDCYSPGTGHFYSAGSPIHYYADIFPHYVAVGRFHLELDKPCISSINFTTNDLSALFYDFDAFSQVVDAKPIIDAVLEERRKMRPVESGEHPLVMYFTGKDCITEVSTAIGKVSVHHLPSVGMGGPTGVSIRNRMVISIQPDQPVTFHAATHRMYELAGFLSTVAGRIQRIGHVQVMVAGCVEGIFPLLDIYSSFPWKSSGKNAQDKPHPNDVPLDPIRRPDEFELVLTHWINRHDSWKTARSQYLECLRKGNKYNTQRLVAAANMFDILPWDAVPISTQLPEDLAATKDTCIAMFRRLSPGIDRNSILSALGRIGQPSLPKKVAHRAAIVDAKLGHRFPNLPIVANIAIKCRNFFVHGSTDGIDYPKLEPLMPFLTNALEFIFVTSDLIEAGWDAQHWEAKAMGWGHSFSRFRSEYDGAVAELRLIISNQ